MSVAKRRNRSPSRLQILSRVPDRPQAVAYKPIKIVLRMREPRVTIKLRGLKNTN